MTPALDQRQRIAPGRAGEPVVAVNPTQTLAVDETQDGGHPASVGQPLGILPPTLPLTGRACLARRRGHFLNYGLAAPALSGDDRQANTKAAHNLGRAIMRRGSQFQLGNHSPCRVTDLPKTYHLERSSSVAGFDDQQHSEASDGTVLYHRGELLDHQGARQHECC